jgi:phosphopantetheinyl transferase
LVGGDKQVIGIYNIRSYRWLALEQGFLDVGILAQMLPKQDEQTWDVQVQLFQCNSTEASDRVLVFEGYVRLCDRLQPSLSPITSTLENPKPHIWSDGELYTTGMFHGDRFQSVKHIREVAEQGIEADLQVISIANFFSHTQQPVFQINAPLLDAATQLVAYWVVDKFRTTMFHTFPFQIGAFHQYQTQLSAGSKVLCRGLMRFTSEQQIESNFDFIDETGQVIARLEGLQEIYLTLPQDYHYCRKNPPATYWSEPWFQMETGLLCRRILPQSERFLEALGGVMKHIVAHLMLNAKEREHWYGLPEKGHRRCEWLLGRIAAKDALRQWAKQTFQRELAPVDIQILSTQSGKPLVHCPELERLAQLPDLSISHSRGYIVAALASPGRCIGIDVQRLEGIRVDDLLSGAFTQQELDLLAPLPQPDRSRSIVGLWCAKEAAAKAAGMGLMGNPRQWQVIHYSPSDQQVVIIHAGKSFQIQLYYTEGEILAICQHNLK